MATTASSSRIDLTWTDASDNEDGFQIERCETAGCTAFAPAGQVGPNVTTFSDSGLAAGTTYDYRVRAFNTGGPSEYSNTAEATTSVGPLPPGAPSNLAATAASASQINLSWTDNSSDETGFEIERCQGAGCTNFAPIAQAAANSMSYSDTGRPAATTFTYRIRAVNAAGGSGYSNTASATTQAQPRSHVGDLDGSTTATGVNWRATITVAVHNDTHALVSGATVSANWGGAESGAASCTTNAAGVCSVTSGQLKRNAQPNVTFTVVNVTHSTLTYSAASNHDPDGDSNGTTINVLKP